MALGSTKPTVHATEKLDVSGAYCFATDRGTVCAVLYVLAPVRTLCEVSKPISDYKMSSPNRSAVTLFIHLYSLNPVTTWEPERGAADTTLYVVVLRQLSIP